ncbi:hypothetical protein ACI65C_013690 [Semiaphis heraclei]
MTLRNDFKCKLIASTLIVVNSRIQSCSTTLTKEKESINIVDVINEDDDGLVESKNSSVSSDEEFYTGLIDVSPITQLAQWAIEHNISNVATSDLLKILIRCYDSTLPIDNRTLLKTDFYDEIVNIITNGIQIKNKSGVIHNKQVIINTFCCDVPAKSFILKTKGHSEGEYLNNRVRFPDLNCHIRTHEQFLQKQQEEHQFIYSNMYSRNY